MSKKSKKTPPPAGARSDSGPATVALKPAGLPVSAGPVAQAELPPGLIRFDRKVRWFLGLCAALFFVLTFLKIHYSSIPMWNQILPDGSDPKRGLVSGTARPIRMDEWAVMVPFMLSQAQRDFPTQNPSIGGDQAPLVANLPVKHPVVVFRPDYWGFLLFDEARGLAWWWNFKYFFSLAAVTLFFLAFTRNRFWLSVFGSFWVVFSSGMVWWSMYPVVVVSVGSLTLALLLQLLFSRNRRHLLLPGVLLAYFAAFYALHLYPPFQVPMAYVLLALLAGFLVKHRRSKALTAFLPLKLTALALAAAGIAICGWLYYQEARTTFDLMAGTVYPGRRMETGGTGFVANWFSEYYSWLLTDRQIPAGWLNICELSHSVTFAPVVFLSLVLIYTNTKAVDPVLLALSGIILILLAWIEIGFPEWLARGTLLGTSPTRRTQVLFGTANVFLTVLYLDSIQDRSFRLPGLVSGFGVVFCIGLLVYAAGLNLSDSGGFLKLHQILVPTLFFTVLSVLLLPSIQWPYKTALFSFGMVFFLLPNLRANPVSVGLSPITDHALYKTVREIQAEDPAACWVVMGSQYISYLVEATGVNLLSGVKNQPDFRAMRVLDPTAVRDSAYNRYAHTTWNTYIDGRDSVVIVNTFQDAYSVGIDPCSSKLKSLGVKYLIFDRQPQAVETRCLSEIRTLGSLHIYRRND
ncbi:DUF7657 domain-containing protein [Larkinella soli]|uniref:DUF7657 domain-containing protein n=1 Tax=Larkinella soli TaxID=1770527 RepID=UPI000FFCA627|nr:hypothetical protein [Larkinella soli]